MSAKIAFDMIETAASKTRPGGAYGTAIAESAEVRALRTIVESEGLRVRVERNPKLRELEITCTFTPDAYNAISSMTEDAIEDMRIDEAMGAVIDHVKRAGTLCRGRVFVDMFKRGVDAIPPEEATPISELLVAFVTKHVDSATCERLALDLISHVERIKR